MALKASGAYRHCKPCAGSSSLAASRRQQPYYHGTYAESGSDRFHCAYQRAGSSAASTPRLHTGGAMSSGDITPSVSARTDFLADDEEGDMKRERRLAAARRMRRRSGSPRWSPGCSSPSSRCRGAAMV
ncbi:hypothetical protein ZEAMMB73_Zm00001d023750 [Zea mays]|uniref:Uncharacterized protein n=1 Tax=Zea mays TaxID=4577 RepID=A0A1D6IVE2_MAIZE|nr:hypothetical protein ZEAMMB73_Zm00001d023750 [Zea mays]